MFLLPPRPRWALSLFLPLALVGCTPARAQTTRVEAEAHLTAGDAKVVELPDASGGKAVSIPRDWQPLLIADVPATGDAFTVWLRYKDAPVLAKADLPGGQKDLTWLWDKPAALTWKRVGRYSRAELGAHLVVIRGGDGGQGPVLDCAVFAMDDAYDPNADKTVPALAPAKTKAADDKANLGEGAQVALGAKDTPDGALFKASDFAAADVVDADGALGGKAVTSKNDWQPLVSIPLPKGGDAFKVWVHRKGGPFCVKTAGGDRWFWSAPDRFEWQETDVFARADLPGEKLVLGRNDGGDKPNTVRIDAVVLSPAVKRPLPLDQPDPKAPAKTVRASVDWSQTVGNMAPDMWGVNDQASFADSSAKYQTLFSALGAPLVRLHQGDFVAKLTDPAKRDWDEAKVKAMFAQARKLYGNARVMVCINALPAWIADGRPETMTPADEDAFAAFCARLVSLAKADKFQVAAWEVPNEWDGAFERANRLPALWRTWNKCALAMRAADPAAKIGGPALTWAKPEWVNGFLDACPSADFLTWHNYATGDLYETNETVFANAGSNVGALARGAMQMVAAHKRAIPGYLTEVNVKYTWDPFERRHQNSVGAVFLALAAREVAMSGARGMTLWAQRGHAYGSLIDENDATHPAYDLYQLGARNLVGALAGTKTDDAAALQLLAVKRADGSRAVLLINQTGGTISIPGAGKWLPGAKVARITASGTVASTPVAGADVSLPGYSLALLTG